jgi:ornithine cyclodeaminase
VYHGNHARGLTSHLATIILLDHETGALHALLDGRYITEARTAAVSAVSARHLAKANASTLALIGSGVQARSHLDAMLKVRPITHARVWSRNTAHREAFAASASAEHGITVTAAPDAATAVRGADIIVLATASPTPVIRDEDVSAGAHICAVGACRPDQREVPTSLVSRSRVYVDSRAGALKEAGDLLLPIGEGAISAAHIVGELGELLLGRILGRTSPAQVTFFESLGMAIEDIVAAELAVRHARARGIGRPLSLT